MAGRVKGLPRGWWAAAMLLATVVWSPAGLCAGIGRGPEPTTRIELQPFGYEGLQPEHLVAGSSMLTVDFVDDNHVLVTFEVRRLLKREVNAGPGEQDRTVTACLAEISTGKLVAKTEWRLHDRSQYLWNLGNGRFLLRVRNELSVFAPMAGTPEEAFRTSPILTTNRHIVAVLLTADRDLLTVESIRRPDAAAGDVAVHMGAEPNPVQINFYRVKQDEAGRLMTAGAGAIVSRAPAALPMNAVGYLDILEGGKNTWYFNFDEHGGKVDELLAFDTTCFPRPVFVGHSEFVVFGCKAGNERRIFAGFNLRGEEMWQQGFYEPYIAPTFSFSPAAGRFALGRTIVGIPLPDDAALSAASVVSQDVRVYQMHTGRQLFRIECTPAERAGHNFALSDDGLRVAVVREMEVHHKATSDTPAYTGKAAGVEIYPFPPLSDQDKSDVKAAAITAPKDDGSPIDEALARIAAAKSSAKVKPEIAGKAPTEPAEESDATASGATHKEVKTAETPAEETTKQQTPTPEPAPEPRKPPTLYGPDEKPEHK